MTYLLHEFVDILVGFFRGQLIIAFLQGLLFAVGFSLIGLRYGFIIGMALGMLNIVPYLGSMVGLAVALPIAFFQADGGVGTCLLLLVVFAVVQQFEGWFLTPRIMGSRTGLHFMAIVVAILFWGTVFDSVLGLVLAIPLTAFLESLWHLAREKYIPGRHSKFDIRLSDRGECCGVREPHIGDRGGGRHERERVPHIIGPPMAGSRSWSQSRPSPAPVDSFS